MNSFESSSRDSFVGTGLFLLRGSQMHSFSNFLAAGTFLAGVALANAPAQAATLVPFATYSQDGVKTTVNWTKVGANGGAIFSTLPGGVISGAAMVHFNFLDNTLYANNLLASLTLSGVAAPGNPASNSVVQGAIAGSFNFLYMGPTQTVLGKTYTSGVTNLLSGVYTLGQISGSGTSGSFHDSTNVGTLTFASDIITNLSTATVQDFSLGLVSIDKPLSYALGQSLNSFKAGATGIFSAGFVPEPDTWAIMITGLGMLSLAVRRRRRLACRAS